MSPGSQQDPAGTWVPSGPPPMFSLGQSLLRGPQTQRRDFWTLGQNCPEAFVTTALGVAVAPTGAWARGLLPHDPPAGPPQHPHLLWGCPHVSLALAGPLVPASGSASPSLEPTSGLCSPRALSPLPFPPRSPGPSGPHHLTPRCPPTPLFLLALGSLPTS